MVVEDDAVWQELLRRMVSQSGYHCETASSVEQAIEMLGTQSYELAILDLRLTSSFDEADRSGLNVVKWLRLNHSNVKAIILSAYVTIDSMQQAFKSGMVIDVFSKSDFEPSELIARLKETLES